MQAEWTGLHRLFSAADKQPPACPQVGIGGTIASLPIHKWKAMNACKA